jgi:dTDP-4-dehydrorhamnose 3,5-epimerase
MHFSETPLCGAFVIGLEERRDHRGFFARAFCSREFNDHGINNRVVQANVSHNFRAGTLRGMHYQIPPAAETKFLRCTRGAIYDVIVDLRADSPTRGQHFGVELSAVNRSALFVPEGFAHGFITLEDDSEVFYLVSEFYAPDCERGLRFDDPALGIAWPRPVVEVSDKDRSWPLLDNGFKHVMK